jgi:AcrB/AcrD/AcrF family
MLNVPIENIFATLQTQLGSLYVNDLNLFGRTFRVIAQADSAFREDPEDVGKLRTRSATGASVPLGTILSIETRTGRPASSVTISTLPLPSMGTLRRASVPAKHFLPWLRFPTACCPMDLASSGPR